MYRLTAIFSVFVLLLLPQTSSACAVCMGGANSPIAPAMNASIFLLMGFIGLMLSGVCGFALYIYKRSKKIPPQFHEELAVMICEQ
jgi:hypothetical protein